MSLKVKQSNLKTEKKPEQPMKMVLAAWFCWLTTNNTLEQVYPSILKYKTTYPI